MTTKREINHIAVEKGEYTVTSELDIDGSIATAVLVVEHSVDVPVDSQCSKCRNLSVGTIPFRPVVFCLDDLGSGEVDDANLLMFASVCGLCWAESGSMMDAVRGYSVTATDRQHLARVGVAHGPAVAEVLLGDVMLPPSAWTR